jgi:hypothetical protein
MLGGWRRLHNEKLHNFYTSPDISKVIKSRRIRWEIHVARMGEMRNASIFWLENLMGRYKSKDLGIDGKIILE